MSFRRAAQGLSYVSALSQDIDNRTCPACSHTFKTAQGLNSHLSSSKKCAWYCKGKRRQLEPLEIEEVEMTVEDEVEERMSRSVESEGEGEGEGDPGDLLDELNDTLFQFVPLSASASSSSTSSADIHLPTNHASTSTSTRNGDPGTATFQSSMRLDDDTDERVEDIDEMAGKVIRMDATLRDRWKRLFRAVDADAMEVDGDDDPVISNRWAPFASELDWRVAKWAVQEGAGHNSFDRLLAIPGVRNHVIAYTSVLFSPQSCLLKVQAKLGLSFDSTRSLHQLVDSIPDRATWKSKHISFRDLPKEKHLIQYRDPLDAIRSLLGNPSHASHIVYRPSRIFTDSQRKDRIYSEMWTGKWWSSVQVSVFHTFQCLCDIGL